MQCHEFKQHVNDVGDRHAEQLIMIGEDLFYYPERRLKERGSVHIFAREFSHLGLGYVEDLVITGLKTVVSRSTGTSREIGVIGAMAGVNDA